MNGQVTKIEKAEVLSKHLAQIFQPFSNTIRSKNTLQVPVEWTCQLKHQENKGIGLTFKESAQ